MISSDVRVGYFVWNFKGFLSAHKGFWNTLTPPLHLWSQPWQSILTDPIFSPWLSQAKSQWTRQDITYVMYHECFRKICNNMFLSSKYPESMWMGIIVNIFKNGDYYDPHNYRGITLNSVLGKLFGRILKNRLEKFVEKNELIDHKRIGLKKARIADHMFVIDTLYKKYVKHGNKTLYMFFYWFLKRHMIKYGVTVSYLNY